MSTVRKRVGIDTGGTFTDFVVLHSDGRWEGFKLRSNPRAPHEVILAGLAQIGARDSVVHGSTIATNALLERRGVRTAFVTTAGFEDLLEIGRQNRAELYNLTPPPKRLLIPRDLCFGVDERVEADGSRSRTPSPAALRKLARQLKAAAVESVAVCFLHAYQVSGHERMVVEALGDLLPVSVSHAICPEFREYERAATTAVNAYVGPLMERYLAQLPAGVAIMQSNGGSLTREEASGHAVRTILSGPAGGAVGTAAVAQQSGFRRVLGFDMGGTSTDVCLSENGVRETVEACVDGLPIRIPMLEIHTVGAGGGSLAFIDDGGLLRVGPQSAGSDPGPACYGKGDQPTVTDAHVVLGRIDAHQFLGGAMPIHPQRALEAVGRVAEPLGLSTVAAAQGILRIANSNIERAIRVVSVERGHDPRDFALLAFGGCGGLHACEIAAGLGIRTVLAPEYAGMLSALGMLIADRVRDYAAGVISTSAYEEVYQRMEQDARRDLPGCRLERLADLRYQGQSYELTVPWKPRNPARLFHTLHEKTYGYQNPARAVEIVTLRLRARIKSPRVALPKAPATDRAQVLRRKVHAGGRWHTAPVYQRNQVPLRWLPGPALLADYGSTTVIPPGWRFRRDLVNTVVIEQSKVIK